ncbi:MAG: Inner membrane protein YbaL [Verrucomicrobia bacterium ADurb.Bin345]|nr:MAG: Inner membrane protein YbaL [Verrucomicrobia bacterium ADurb.Bin345]
MNETMLLHDLAVVMTAAGVAALVAHAFNQPKILGYILAGVVIGPHTPPFSFVHNEATIRTLADLGILFLMFSLGLEFNLRRLREVGRIAFITAALDVALMLYAGYQLGRWFGWGTLESLFLGAIICDSSTTVLAKLLRELDKSQDRFAHIVYATTLVEDLLAIALIAVLTGLASTGSLQGGQVAVRMVVLAVFLVVVLVVGLLLVPRFLTRVARYRNDELLVIVVLALAFGVCLLAVRLDLSLALGAFLIGAIMAESGLIGRIEMLVAPFRHMFTAVFLVAIGLLVQPLLMVQYLLPIMLVALVIITAKWINCSVGSFLGGSDLGTSFRVGIAMGQVAEFAFIIAALGLSLDVTRPEIYQVAVGAAVLSVILNPYLIRHADRLAALASRIIPANMQQTLGVYTHWIHQLREESSDTPLARTVRRSLRLVLINTVFIVALFMVAGYAASHEGFEAALPFGASAQRGLLWLMAVLLALPFYVANFRKIQALGMMLAEVTIPPSNQTGWARNLRALVGALTLFLGVAGMALLTFLLSSAFLPSPRALILLVGVVAVVTGLSWRTLVRVYARAQSEVRDLFAREAPAAQHPSLPATIGALLDRDVYAVTVPVRSPVIGRSIPEIELRSKTGATVVSIERGTEVLLASDASVKLDPGDRVLLLGEPAQIETVRELFSGLDV